MAYDEPLLHKRPAISVLVSGKSGTSKSVLINGILGKEVIKERAGLETEARSSDIEFYSEVIDGVTVNVWVSSQLQDGIVTNEQKYLNELSKNCSSVDFIMYCLKMTETRFIPGNPDHQAMEKLTRALGPQCWKKTVFVLTFANLVADNLQTGLSKTEESVMFQNNIQTWKTIVKNTLMEANVPENCLNFRIVPSGHYKQLHLPDREYWLSSLWSECYEAIYDSEARHTFKRINSSRFRSVQEIRTENISRFSIFQQPLINREAKPTPNSGQSKAVIRSTAYGAIVGGILGLGLGSLSTSFLWAVVSMIFGAILGACAGFMMHKKYSR